MLTWMRFWKCSARKSHPLFRFRCDVSYVSGKVDLRPFEDLWARAVGPKSNLKKGIFIDSLISFLVPDVSLLSEPFKEDILRLLEANAPTRRRILKINDRDVCKLSFGYVVFGVSFWFRNLVWELYKLDCNSVADVISNHPISQRISGTLSIPYELASDRDGSPLG